MPAPQGQVILVADDNADQRALYVDLLTYNGFRVIEARDGEEAIDRARAERPALILMDVTMPGTSGWNAVRALREQVETSTIPIIVITGLAQTRDRDASFAAGSDAYLSKPVAPRQLLEEVRRFPARVITGHLGIAAALHASRRDSSLGWLLGASMAPDVVDGLFVVARTCNPHGLYSHTLPAAALIAVLTGAIAYLATDQRATGLLAALLVLVHVPLDFVTGYKLFWPGAELAGLRLYDRPVLDFVLESALVTAAWWWMRGRSWAPRWATTWAALAGLVALQGAMDLAGRARGGVKPSACARPAAPPLPPASAS